MPSGVGGNKEIHPPLKIDEEGNVKITTTKAIHLISEHFIVHNIMGGDLDCLPLLWFQHRGF